jgi:hypothetical protein
MVFPFYRSLWRRNWIDSYEEKNKDDGEDGHGHGIRKEVEFEFEWEKTSLKESFQHFQKEFLAPLKLAEREKKAEQRATAP